MSGLRGAFARRGPLPLMAAALLLTSCSRKIIAVDPDAFPEGMSSPSQLVMHLDTPHHLEIYERFATGPNEFRGRVTYYRKAAGVAHGMIFDFTAATEYQVHRREAGGGFAPLKDYLLQPSKRWLDSQSEIYSYTDEGAGASGGDYVGRGVVDHAVTPLSPLTNVARLRASAVRGDEIRVTTDTLRLREDPVDSTRGTIRRIEWTPATGAAGYWLQVYQVRDQTTFGLFSRGFAAAVFPGRGVDYLVGWIPAPLTQFDSLSVAAGARILMNRPLIYSQPYEIRVSAVDADGQLISFTYDAPGANQRAVSGDPLNLLAREELPETYIGFYHTGSFELFTENPPLPPPPDLQHVPAAARRNGHDLATRPWKPGRR